MSALRIMVFAAAFVLATGAARAETRTLTVDPARSLVAFTLEATGHDVEGTFAAPTGTVTFDASTGAASGSIQVDLRSGQTGNKSRDKTMHGDVLESAAHPTAVLRVERIEGAVQPSGTSKIFLHAVLSFHGADHPLKLPASVSISGSRATADVTFSIPFVEWGLHDPSIFILRVSKTVAVHVKAEGDLSPGPSVSR